MSQANQRQILFHDCSIFLCLFVDPLIINLQKNIFFHEELSGRHAAEASGLTVKILLFTKRKITQYRMKGSVPLFGSHYSIAFAGRIHVSACRKHFILLPIVMLQFSDSLTKRDIISCITKAARWFMAPTGLATSINDQKCETLLPP